MEPERANWRGKIKVTQMREEKKKKTGVVKIYGSCRNKMDSWENPSKT